MKHLIAFGWGYRGWGNHTRDFVRMADAVERARGKRPPIFVDIRFSRSVRALGFRNSTFGRMVGKNRYRWLRKLGNARISSGGMKILDPSGAEDLLEQAIDAARQRRRIIFFCSCPSEYPCECHRTVVAGLLLNAARRRKRSLTVVEWPGGEPATLDLTVPETIIAAVLRGANRVPLAHAAPRDIRKFGALPWGSRVRLRSKRRQLAIISGPAKLSADWFLPVIGPEVSKADDTIKNVRSEALRLRKSRGFCERRS